MFRGRAATVPADSTVNKCDIATWTDALDTDTSISKRKDGTGAGALIKRGYCESWGKCS
jgi:hypothetical protein